MERCQLCQLAFVINYNYWPELVNLSSGRARRYLLQPQLNRPEWFGEFITHKADDRISIFLSNISQAYLRSIPTAFLPIRVNFDVRQLYETDTAPHIYCRMLWMCTWDALNDFDDRFSIYGLWICAVIVYPMTSIRAQWWMTETQSYVAVPKYTYHIAYAGILVQIAPP